MPHFFIDRPVFAWVIAIMIMLAGILSVTQLPIEQYPNIAPPSVSISAVYPGADAKTVENSVTQVIEQKLTGIDNLRYISSSSSDNSMSITLTFEPNVDPDIAQVQTQNKLQSALPQLPLEVQSQGVSVSKSNNSFLLVVGFYSKNGSTTDSELGDFLSSYIQDPISRIQGVGSVTVFGEQHAMRIWLDPSKLLSYNLNPTDISNAVSIQNIDISAGQLGGLPSENGQLLNATVRAQSRLQTPNDFENIILRVNTDGSQVRLRDVARVEIGSEAYERIVRYKRKPAAGLAVSLATGANALDTAARVKTKIKELSSVYPDNVEVIYPYDTTPFVKLSIENVIKTLLEAIVLVFLVMYLFLQNFRATLIPTIAVPVVLLGTFCVLYTLGFTINVLTMFAMVLAIGLLVDDAIVVVENVERIMNEENLSPKEATRKSMTQITGALVGIAVVLSAVFIPMAFFGGSVGGIYRQFSITIVSAMALSVLVALILSPSLCATILKPKNPSKKHTRKGFAVLFNRYFNKSRDGFESSVSYIVHRIKRFTIIYLLLVAGLVVMFISLPKSFLPDEDQGTMFLMLNSPSGSTAERTLKSVTEIEDYILENESDTVEHLFTVTGFSFAGVAQNTAIGFLGLKDWDIRHKKEDSVFSIAGRTMGAISTIKDAIAYAFFPPPIRELGNASGFDFQLLDRSGLGHNKLMDARNELLIQAGQNSYVVGVRPNGLDDVPQFKIEINSEKAAAMGVSLQEINRTLQIAWGSQYINDFLDKDRIKKVYIQSDSKYRMQPDDFYNWYVRNDKKQMVPFSAFSKGTWTYGSPKLERFNGNASVNIQGAPAQGISTGQAMDEMVQIVKSLGEGFDLEWSGLSYEEKLSNAQTPLLYGLSIIVIFLCLAALYESWAIPFAVLLVIPLGIIGTVLLAKFAGLKNDVYFQVSMLTTIGLSAKNAILIVEFAKEKYQNGMGLVEATLYAFKIRYRPILMTSMAFILGVTPLALSTGAGSGSQNAIGIGVIGGMITATTLVILFVPMFFIMIQKRMSNKK
jgi:multidrug efflux pump